MKQIAIYSEDKTLAGLLQDGLRAGSRAGVSDHGAVQADFAASIVQDVADLKTAALVIWSGYKTGLNLPDIFPSRDIPPILVIGDAADCPSALGPYIVDQFPLPIRLGVVLDRISYVFAKRGRLVDIDQAFAFGPFVFENQELRVVDTGQNVKLTDKEKSILALLQQSVGHKVDRKTLLDRVWGYADTVETHTLETHIYRLRQKIEVDPAAPQLLLTDGNFYHLNGVQVQA